MPLSNAESSSDSESSSEDEIFNRAIEDKFVELFSPPSELPKVVSFVENVVRRYPDREVGIGGQRQLWSVKMSFFYSFARIFVWKERLATSSSKGLKAHPFGLQIAITVGHVRSPPRSTFFLFFGKSNVLYTRVYKGNLVA